MTKATDGAGATPRPTGKNAEQDAELSALKAQVELMAEQKAAMTAAMSAPAAPARKAAPLVVDNDEAAKAVLAARSDTPKTYRALQDGTDITQGFIPVGTVFSTTQPPGSWMEEVE